MRVTAWSNGKPSATGAGYGLKITALDRDRYFHREWTSVTLLLDGQAQPVIVNISKKSFWAETCRELISADVGRWLIENGLAPWQKGIPPQLSLEPLDKAGRFLLTRS